MRAVFLVILLILISAPAHSAWLGNVHIENVYVQGDGFGMIRITNPPTDTMCDNFSHDLQFDVNSFGGDAMHKNLLTAAVLGSLVGISYIPSSVPGMDAASGCTREKLAVITGVAFVGN